MSIIDIKYNQKKQTPSDINEHLETLYNYAKECDAIAEFGVFEVTSSYALAAARPKKLICVDIKSNNFIENFINECQIEGINLEFYESSTLNFLLEEVDLLFIDTLHAYSQLIQELRLHHTKVKKYIILHDTVSFANNDEINYTGLLNDRNINEQGKRGLLPAVEDFIKENPHWIIVQSFPYNNGLMVLKNINQK